MPDHGIKITTQGRKTPVEDRARQKTGFSSPGPEKTGPNPKFRVRAKFLIQAGLRVQNK